MIVDFHVHSTFSDGTCTPEELTAKAKGFAAWAITDHDNCDAHYHGGAGRSTRFPISGIELSVEPGTGFDQFHLLGLGIDAQNAGLKGFLKKILEGRKARNEKIVDNFRRLGFEMDLGELMAKYAHGEVLARPHFARWLLNHGVVKSIPEAFQKYLMADSPAATRCYEERYQPSQEEAIRVVHAAGGIAVMAHPRYWRYDWREKGVDFDMVERNLPPVIEKGLDGLEALYQANSLEMNVRFTMMATKLGLLKSAGSDFHGANKPTIPLGMEVSEQFIAPLLERL